MEKAYLSLLNSFFFLIFVFINPKSFLAFKINTHKLKQAFRQNCPFWTWKTWVRCEAFTTKQENQQKELKSCPFRGLRTDELRFARSRQRTERDGVILHHEFRMQFAKTEKRTKEATLAKRIAFRRKAFSPLSSERRNECPQRNDQNRVFNEQF
ncbi:hypothetical protein LEP1GSC066_1587 [Leptospira sp. serovar Kenya str. Sh9]|nr:hypothetical protein LEP1GSC066_1587 [Leptospira sp. serovar Kenya str. Sh9]